MSGGSDVYDEETIDGEDDSDTSKCPRLHFQSFIWSELKGIYAK